MQRCRQTAAPLEKLWQQPAEIMTAVAEIPAPSLGPEQRSVWLQHAMAGTWAQLQQRAQPGWPDYLGWRSALLQRIHALTHDSVIFSHYIAINAIVGAALRNDNMVCMRPDHASITVIDAQAGNLHVVELGRQAETLVLTRN